MSMSDKEKLAAYEKMVETRKKHTARRQAKINIILKKAEKAGITCSSAEIDQYLKEHEE